MTRQPIKKPKKKDKLPKLHKSEIPKLRRLNPYQQISRLDRIPSGRDHWEMAMGRGDATWADYISMIFRQGQKGIMAHRYTKDKLERALDKTRGKPVQAIINHNRWIALCECGGAEVVDYKSPKFYCFSCMNIENKGYPRRVSFPRAYRKLERRLIIRPHPLNRNWTGIESLEELEAENVAHNLPEKLREEHLDK